MNKIELKSISDLLGMNFFIPSYQRGYRWTEQQVKDLLDDIQEFIDKESDGFYCIQPLVVKEREQATFQLIKEQAKDLSEIKNLLKGSWEVIDGQQRLTTIYILLAFLNSSEKYFLEYETRKDSNEFLKKIDTTKADHNIDYYHIVKANEQIKEWFTNKDDKKDDFLRHLLSKVKFIWYESTEEDSIKVFTRLNIGKISLTNAELIKALFLNKSNFQEHDYQKVRLQQQEIASQWDTIEYTLQNDEFWLFLHKADYDKPTRIDFIFDLICKKDILNLKLNNDILGTDEYKTFRYFYYWFKEQGNDVKIMDCWKEVKTLFQTFQEWFNDLELYHYVGFLIEQGIDITDLFDNWKDNQLKNDFVSYLKKEIKRKTGIDENAGWYSLIKKLITLSYGDSLIRPILLLHNIQSVINQNNRYKDNEKYKLPVFYKFPFHLFKKEKKNGGWDVEHIDSHTENQLEKLTEQKEWLKYSTIGIDLPAEVIEKVKKFINIKRKEEDKPDFDSIYEEIIKIYQKSDIKNKLSEEAKNQIRNLTLLDSSTNRGYGNAIFPAKRRVIIGKDQGKTISVDEDLKIIKTEGAIAFIPLCTKNVFLKYYNSATNNLREWDKDDAKAYLKNIKDVLKEFLN